jgi:hypothetical protein
MAAASGSEGRGVLATLRGPLAGLAVMVWAKAGAGGVTMAALINAAVSPTIVMPRRRLAASALLSRRRPQPPKFGRALPDASSSYANPRCQRRKIKAGFVARWNSRWPCADSYLMFYLET